MSNSRTKNSILNSSSNLFSQFLIYAIKFLVRTIFIKTLNDEILGLNGLFTSILYFLSFAELGISNSIGFALYKPIAFNDKHQIAILLRFFKRVYFFIGLIILFIGISILPFLNIIINKSIVNNHYYIYYLLFVFNSSLSYFFSYKITLLIADQKEYIYSTARFVFIFFQSFLQIIFLIINHSYLLFLLCDLIFTFMLNYVTSFYVDKKYKFINQNKYNNGKISNKVYEKIVILTKANALNNIGSSIESSIDNLVYSTMFGLNFVGYVSNYILVVSSITALCNRIIGGVAPSIGNIGVIDKPNKQYLVFRSMHFVVYLIATFISLSIVFLLNDIIYFWIGGKYVLNNFFVFTYALNFLITTISSVPTMFAIAFGLTYKFMYKKIIEMILNIFLSVLFAKMFGFTGVIAATIVSFLCTTFWMDPYAIYKYAFKKPIINFFIKYLIYIVLFIFMYVIINYFTLNFQKTIINIIIKFIIIFIVFLGTNFILFFKSYEFKYLSNLFLHLIKSKKNY